MDAKKLFSRTAMAALRKERRTTAVRDLMTEQPLTVDATRLMREAAKLFADKPFHHLLITRDGRLAGVLSDRDVLSSLAQGPAALDTPIAEVMTVSPKVIEPSTAISRAVRLLIHYGINCLPVVDEERHPVGIVTTTDCLRLLVSLLESLERQSAV